MSDRLRANTQGWKLVFGHLIYCMIYCIVRRISVESSSSVFSSVVNNILPHHMLPVHFSTCSAQSWMLQQDDNPRNTTTRVRTIII